MISPVRRTTIVVSDMDASLKFYRDYLNMNVFYDQVIQAEASARLMGIPDCKVRLVSLQADDSLNGMVGLLQFITPDYCPRSTVKNVLKTPDTMLLFMADDIDVPATYRYLRDNGAQIVSAPLEYEIPDRGPVSGFTCMDPDGILVAIMRFGRLDQANGQIKVSPTRRTTIVVSDMQQSLAFYRDGLGMQVFYDQVISSPEESKLLGVPGARIRIVSMQSQDSQDGMVGLMEFQSGPVKPRQQVQSLIDSPDIFLIFLTERMHAAFNVLEQNGAKIKCPPVEYEIPGRGICAGFTCYDPDGIVIEFTQFGPL